MSGFDKRREGYESKFAHDEDLRFRATARRDKLLGLWAAEKLGLGSVAAEDYAKEVVKAEFEEPGDHVLQQPDGADVRVQAPMSFDPRVQPALRPAQS